jgi:gamma-glutamylcyclotransferase (GGCT)/AIG2-like uncharacterized protein YtfP
MFNGRYGGAGVANITHATGHIVPGALWEITDTDLVALDKYEGYPSLYGRNNDFEVTLPNGDKIEVLTYFMVSYKLGALPLSIPSEMYFNIIKEGYNDFGLSLYYLAEAYHTTVGEIWRQKNKKAGVDNYESFGFSSK